MRIVRFLLFIVYVWLCWVAIKMAIKNDYSFTSDDVIPTTFLVFFHLIVFRHKAGWIYTIYNKLFVSDSKIGKANDAPIKIKR